MSPRPSRLRRAARLKGRTIVSLTALVAIAGRASVQHTVALRAADDLLPATEAKDRYALPDRKVGDVLWFEPDRPSGMEARDLRRPFRLSVSEVRSVDAWFPDAGRTVIVVVVVTLVGAAALAP